MVIQFDIKTFTEYCIDDETLQSYGVANPFGLDIMIHDNEVDLIEKELTHPRIFSYVKPYVLYNGDKYVITPSHIKVMNKKYKVRKTLCGRVDEVLEDITDRLEDETKSIIMFAPVRYVVWTTNKANPVKFNWSFYYAEINGETY